MSGDRDRRSAHDWFSIWLTVMLVVLASEVAFFIFTAINEALR